MSNALLLILMADGALREVPLRADEVVIGRDPVCDVVVDARLISRQHARIRRAGGSYILEDLDSRNGTSVNGTPLAGAPHLLRDGDQIELGGVGRLTFIDSDATSTRPLPAPIGVWLEAATQDVWVDGQRLSPPLSRAQYLMLDLLATRPDQVCSRDEIVAAVWPDIADGVSDEALDALIKRVRARLGEVPGGAAYLVTLRGRGLLLKSRK